MRYNDNRLFPRLRDKMRDLIHSDAIQTGPDLKAEDLDDDESLTWRQYIL